MLIDEYVTTTMSFSSLPPLPAFGCFGPGNSKVTKTASSLSRSLRAGAVEELAADALHRQRADVAEDDRGGVELVAAEFGHQSAAGLV